MQKLILISGDLASGKSHLAEHLSSFFQIPAFTKDHLKEILADTVGFTDRKTNKNLSIASIAIMKECFEKFSNTKMDIILEANFHQKEIEALLEEAKKRSYQVILLFLKGDIDYLFLHFTNRRINEKRHIAHLTCDIITLPGFTDYIKESRNEVKSIPFQTILVHDNNYDEVFETAKKIIINEEKTNIFKKTE